MCNIALLSYGEFLFLFKLKFPDTKLHFRKVVYSLPTFKLTVYLTVFYGNFNIFFCCKTRFCVLRDTKVRFCLIYTCAHRHKKHPSQFQVRDQHEPFLVPRKSLLWADDAAFGLKTLGIFG